MSGPVDATPALVLLWQMAQHDNGGARVCARLLLGLYNGQRFPFDLTDLRLLDDKYLEAALQVIRMDARLTAEVHDLLDRAFCTHEMGARFELLACDWKLKGRCNKENEKSARAYLASKVGQAKDTAPRATA